ncbi:DMT family transporter [Sulfuritalea sp.]|uniref:DMT family transporter n=1 Tax=Sulfuritalea sp. TaxID=2480090 RepID=UPI00286E9197|nr:DMT family transporter [Sulfuritalea sp.]
MQSLWMVAASLLFASMGVCVKLGAAQFAAAELVFWRGFIATLLLGSFILVRRLPLATPHMRTHVVRGLAGFVSLVMYFYAISLIPLAAAVTLNYTSPLFLALLLVLWLKEPVRRGFYAVLAAGFVGVVFLLQPTLARDQWLGAAFGLGSGIISSIAYLNVRRLGELGEPEWRTVFYFSALSALGGLPWLLLANPFHAIDLRGWLLLLGVGGFGVLAQLCMTAAYKRGKTLVSASLAYSTVVFSSAFGMLLWDETLPWSGWLGVILIVASGVLATAFSRRTDTAAVTD